MNEEEANIFPLDHNIDRTEKELRRQKKEMIEESREQS